MTTNQDREFFEKKLGWRRKFVRLGDKGYTGHGFVWVKPQKDIFEEDVYGRELPSPSTSLDDFQKWVVPELLRNGWKSDYYRKIGWLLTHKTPANALAWAMEEIPDAS